MMNPHEVIELIERDLSLASRVRAVLVGLAGFGMAVLLGLLWATEPGGLPPRAAIGFAVMIAIGLSWAGYAVWVSTRRRPLYAHDSVIAGRMATAFAGLFAVSAPILVAVNGSRAWPLALAVGAGMVGLAGVLWRTGVARHRRLVWLRDELTADG
jgi:drug/metabolite transporter (DMT)-like permease